MANRRMISIGIINSAKFLKMPMSSRLLYYDLCLRADDDGVVEGFNILRMTGASEDDLRVLAAKDYVKILNEDLVSYITDWTEHNKLRADRKVNSIYQDLLLQVLPDIKLLEPKQRADRIKNLADMGQTIVQPHDGHGTVHGTSHGLSRKCSTVENIGLLPGTSHGLTYGCPMSAEDRLGKDRLGKDRLGKDRGGEDTYSTPISFSTPTHEIIFNQFGLITYRTWFENSIIKTKGDLITIMVKEPFMKDIIQDKFLETIKILTGKNVMVNVGK